MGINTPTFFFQHQLYCALCSLVVYQSEKKNIKMIQTVAVLSTLLVATSALSSVQVVNTNANLQSQSQNQYPGYSRPNQFYVTGAVRSYHGGYYPYPSQDYYNPQGYRYRRQAPISPIVKEANSQYQYQGNNQYDERVNPVWGNEYTQYPYSDAYRYRENNQYQLQGNAQSRVEGDPRYGDQFNNISNNNNNNRFRSQQQGALYRQRYQY